MAQARAEGHYRKRVWRGDAHARILEPIVRKISAANPANSANPANPAYFSSRQSQAAVDSQRLAGDEVWTRCEKKHGLSDIGG